MERTHSTLASLAILGFLEIWIAIRPLQAISTSIKLQQEKYRKILDISLLATDVGRIMADTVLREWKQLEENKASAYEVRDSVTTFLECTAEISSSVQEITAATRSVRKDLLSIQEWLQKHTESSEQRQQLRSKDIALIEGIKVATRRLQLFEAHLSNILRLWEEAEMSLEPVYRTLQVLQVEPKSRMRFDWLNTGYTEIHGSMLNYKEEMDELRVRLEYSRI